MGAWNTFVCCYAHLTLAIARLGQALVATIIFSTGLDMESWSSELIEATAAFLDTGAQRDVSGRCLRGVPDCEDRAIPMIPRRR